MNSAGNTGQPAVGSAGTPGLMAGAAYGRRPIALAGAGPVALAAALAATLGLAAACWAVTVWRMSGMNMGTATPLGSFGFFIAVWAAMMAAMMLPGAVPAVARRAHAGGVRAVPLFVGSYLAVWALAGVLVYAVELWTPDSAALEQILARAASATLARAIFTAAQQEHPGRHIVLRQGDQVIDRT